MKKVVDTGSRQVIMVVDTDNDHVIISLIQLATK